MEQGGGGSLQQVPPQEQQQQQQQEQPPQPHARVDYVEFCVKAAEDLILEGSERTLVRVRAGAVYSCLMQKCQRFSSLIRHYAKHHGLKKDDLEFCFVEVLKNDETPESVHLQPRDEVIVRKRKSLAELPPVENDLKTICPVEEYVACFGRLLSDAEELSDVTIYAGAVPEKRKICVHKVILAARSDYFRRMFSASMKEEQTAEVNIPTHDHASVTRMLEFIYTNQVSDLASCSTNELISLLSIAEEYCLTSLKKMCEHAASNSLNPSTIVTLLNFASEISATVLHDACMDFITRNIKSLVEDPGFLSEISEIPHLYVDVLKTIGSSSADSRKRSRVSTQSVDPAPRIVDNEFPISSVNERE